MMQPLEIVVTGNADGAKSSLQTVQAELGKTALAAQKTDSALAKVGSSVTDVGTTTVNAFTKTSSGMGSAITNINSKLEPLERHIHSTFHSAFEEATQAGSVMARFAGNIFEALGPLGLLVGALAIPKIVEWIKSIKEASIDVQNFSEINKAAAESVAKQTASLSTLYSIATDVNRSMSARVSAVRELQNEFPDYFKNITQENILNGNAKSAYDALTNSLIANSLAKAQLDKITKIGLQKSDIQAQIDDLNDARKRQIDAIRGNKALAVQGGGGGGLAAPVMQTPEQQRRDINILFDEKIKKIQPKIDAFDSQIKKIRARLNPAALLSGKGGTDNKTGVLAAFDAQIKVLEDYKNNIAMTAGEIANVNAQIKKLKDERDKYDPSSSKTKKTNPFEISLKDLEDNYKKVQALLVSQYDANTTDAKKNTTAINDLLLKAQADFLEKKLALIRQYGKKEGDVDLEIAKTNKALIANQIGFNIEQINTLPKVQGAPNINFKKVTTEKIDPKPYYVLSDAIQKNIKLQQEMKELLDQTTIVLNKTLGPAFDTLFTNILEGSGNAFKAFGDAIKQMLVQLGTAILKAAAFSAILSLLPGSPEFGTIFKKSLGFSKGGEVKGFASGGLISGPGSTTSDSILARLSKGEYIMNASAVSKFGSSFFDSINSGMLPKFNRGGNIGSAKIVTSQSAIDHYFHGEIAGDKLLLLHDRATARRRRNG